MSDSANDPFSPLILQVISSQQKFPMKGSKVVITVAYIHIVIMMNAVHYSLCMFLPSHC